MIQIKNKMSIQKMDMAGSLLSEIMETVGKEVGPGVSTAKLDERIHNLLNQKGLVSRTKGYMGYQHVSCISVNDEVVHGVPTKEKILKDGDLVKIDICASWKGYCADMARCFFVGDVSETIQQLVAVAQCSLKKGIEKAVPGNRLSDISAAIQQEVEKHGYGIVRDFAGHGIGKNMHEDPEVLNYGKPGQGPILRHGMTLAIEPMITLGKHSVYVDGDGWTVKTRDKSIAAHVEDTVLITESGPRVLTRK